MRPFQGNWEFGVPEVVQQGGLFSFGQNNRAPQEASLLGQATSSPEFSPAVEIAR